MDSDKKNLLKIVLSRRQAQEDIRKTLLEGHKFLQENNNVVVEVVIRGFEGDARHPACIKDAKRCYAFAFEEGLAGLLAESNARDLICEMYAMAYLRGKVKIIGGKRVVKFQKADTYEFRSKSLKSCDVYYKLLSVPEEK
uniref:Uncharacterized protein n=1 Tax=Marseillevirus LCMAC101 TaxID=2506602 RepID=A0A481YTI1_9VIRU|nr:MAG: hypothetical protein LCMAC101_07960 [Marseillevirus LCMAC101]